jgi:hypothetical protein
MSAMKMLRWLLVFAFWVAADLSSPVALAPLEAFDGEIEESIHRPGHRQNRFRAPARNRHVAATATAVLARRRPPVVENRAETHDRAARKVPAPAADCASCPEDH